MRTFGVLVAVVTFAGVEKGAAADEVAVVLSKVRAIAAEEIGDPESRLTRAQDVCRAAFEGREWESVRDELQAAGQKSTLDPEASGATNYRYLLIENAHLVSESFGTDLYLVLPVHERRNAPTNAVPPRFTIGTPVVGLHSGSLAAMKQGTLDESFREGSMIREALASWAVAETRTSNPVLDDIDLFRANIATRVIGEPPPSIGLRMTFVKSAEDRARGVILGCRAEESSRSDGKRIDASSWRRREFVPATAIETLATDLGTILASGESSYQRLLQRATRVTQRDALDRDFAELEPVLERIGLKPLDSRRENLHRYVVAHDAYTLASGIKMDLVVEIATLRRESKTERTRWIASSAAAAFDAEVSRPYEEVMKDSLFGKDTAIERALQTKQVREAAVSAKILKSISIRYDTLRDRWRLENPRGFRVTANFIDREPDPIKTASVFVEVASNLDPLGSSSTNEYDVLVQGFVGADTLGEVRYRGGQGGERALTGSPTRALPESPTTFTLLRSGAPRFRGAASTAASSTETVTVHGAGDARALPAATRRVKVGSATFYDADLAALEALDNVEFLDLGDCEGITDEGLRRLGGFRTLEELTLSGEMITGSGFAHLRPLAKLTKLRLHSATRLSDAGVAAIGDLGRLELLSLFWSKALTDEQLASLKGLSNLKEINIWGSSKITDRGLEQLSSLPKLESLTFSHSSSISATGIEALVKLKDLKDVTIGYTPLADDAISSLSRIRSLEYVSLIGLAVTDDGLSALASLPDLKCLSIRECPKVTLAGVQKLKDALGTEFTLEKY